MKKTEN